MTITEIKKTGLKKWEGSSLQVRKKKNETNNGENKER